MTNCGAIEFKGLKMVEWIRKGYRADEETDKKIKELLRIYKLKSENDLFRAIVSDIYELKKSKALVPFEELEKRDTELKTALLEIGRLRGVLEEKEKGEEKKGFWARLFGK